MTDLDREPLLTVRDVAAQLRVKPDIVLSFISAHHLRAVNVASVGSRRPRWRIDQADVDVFLATRRTGTRPVPTRRKRPSTAVEYF
jgi:excisionase family DNA binding protein